MRTAAGPLLGVTVLVVEDSRFACEAMRLLCLRSGARIRRADCLKSARRHLQIYRPTVLVVDLGLPDGSGVDLISELALTTPRVDVILGTSGDDYAQDAALAAGADGFLAKPITSLHVFQETVLALLPADQQPSGPRVLDQSEIRPDPIAYRDDMAHIADVLTDLSDETVLDYVAQFLTGVARSASDHPLEQAADDLARARANGHGFVTNAAEVAGLVQERLSRQVAI